jgi:hypothetical protein
MDASIMSWYVNPGTIGSGLPVDVFLRKLGAQLSTDMDVEFLRKIPLV